MSAVLVPAPPWPTCASCRDWSAGSCHYKPRTARRWRNPPAGGAPLACCGYWHSPSGETRRDRCRALNAALQKTHPPVALREEAS